MLMRIPFVQAKQHHAVNVDELSEIGMRRCRCRLAEQRLIPAQAERHVANADDRPEAFHAYPPSWRRHSRMDHSGCLLATSRAWRRPMSTLEPDRPAKILAHPAVPR